MLDVFGGVFGGVGYAMSPQHHYINPYAQPFTAYMMGQPIHSCPNCGFNPLNDWFSRTDKARQAAAEWERRPEALAARYKKLSEDIERFKAGRH